MFPYIKHIIWQYIRFNCFDLRYKSFTGMPSLRWVIFWAITQLLCMMSTCATVQPPHLREEYSHHRNGSETCSQRLSQLSLPRCEPPGLFPPGCHSQEILRLHPFHPSEHPHLPQQLSSLSPDFCCIFRGKSYSKYVIKKKAKSSGYDTIWVEMDKSNWCTAPAAGFSLRLLRWGSSAPPNKIQDSFFLNFSSDFFFLLEKNFKNFFLEKRLQVAQLSLGLSALF